MCCVVAAPLRHLFLRERDTGIGHHAHEVWVNNLVRRLLFLNHRK